MTSCLVFNHHSLPYSDEEKAISAVPTFLRICLGGQRLGLRLVLLEEHLDPTWFRIELAPDYFWQDWYQQKKEDDAFKDMIRGFRSLETRQPLFTDDDVARGIGLYDVKLVHDGLVYAAVRAAAWYDTFLLGFPTVSPWNASPLSVTVETLNETGDILTVSQDISNICSEGIFESLQASIIERRRDSIRSGRELLANWSTLYPHLSYCGRVQEQLASWSHSTACLTQAKESLAVLDLFSNRWSSLELDDYSHQSLRDLGLNHEVSGESSTVSDTPKLKKFREFYLPSGSKVFFENHIKISNGMRIHFFPENTSRKTYVAYIGSHLPLK